MKKESSGWHINTTVRLKTGDRFFELTAVRKSDIPQVWVFRCDCGREITIMARDVIAGFKNNCGYCKGRFESWEKDPKKLGEQIENRMGTDLITYESERNAEKLRKRDPIYRKAHENRKSIMAIAKIAQEEGMTYGEYVRKYGL